MALLSLAACAPRPKALLGPEPTAKGIVAAKTVAAPYNTGDPVAGRSAFALCADCHSFTVSGKGPSLAGVYGKPAASRPDFAYSEALKNARITWDAKRLDQWIFNPHETLPGTSMGFIGVRNDKKRRDILAYLVAMSVAPAP
jgi:cytochrome c